MPTIAHDPSPLTFFTILDDSPAAWDKPEQSIAAAIKDNRTPEICMNVLDVTLDYKHSPYFHQSESSLSKAGKAVRSKE
ncbi:MAG: hypothetical protein AMK71_03140 [Nitrospira bacterium SG8_35_4]|nr:MAG: hypothetical protein AMK71_03140 [Nitrospira bacterium SG8_35_4]